MGRLFLVPLAGLAVALAAACGGGEGGSSTLGLQSTVIARSEVEGETGLKRARVMEVFSGTRIKADLEDQSLFDVRYIGITVSDPDKVLKDGRTVRQAAFDLNRSMAPPQGTVQLEEGAVNRDGVGNYLRYVYADGEMIGIALVAAGLATVKGDPSDTTHQAELLAAQEEAKANQRGVWEP